MSKQWEHKEKSAWFGRAFARTGRSRRGRRGEVVRSVLGDWECCGEEVGVLVWEVSTVALRIR